MTKTPVRIALNVRKILKLFLCQFLLILIIGQKTIGRPLTSASSKSVEEIRKRTLSRKTRHAPFTSLAWQEVYLHSKNGYNLAVSESGRVYGAGTFTKECEYFLLCIHQLISSPSIFFFFFSFCAVMKAKFHISRNFQVEKERNWTPES